MENIEAKIILKNLLQRVETLEDGTKKLTGKLTDDELDALNFALSLLTGATVASKPLKSPSFDEPINSIPPLPDFVPEKQNILNEVSDTDSENVDESKNENAIFEIDASVLDLAPTSDDIRLCIDFGTAMSKATLVEDDNDLEEIKVLELGKYGDYEDEYMLVSSVYIDDDGCLWFGKKAVDISQAESTENDRQRMDNIKRWLSEGGLDTQVPQQFNPTDIDIVFSDMILAYLMFLSWTINRALEDIKESNSGLARNLSRRFAMPCLDGSSAKDTIHRLHNYLGEAQILADSFYNTLENGISLKDFMHAVSEIRKRKYKFPYISEGITEPLGVAGSYLDWVSDIDQVSLVIDVGAGTSDFSMYRAKYTSKSEAYNSFEIENSSQGISEAGNYLDQLLKQVVLKKAGVDSKNPLWINMNWELEKNIRNYKETLFNEQSVYIALRTGDDVEITLEEFLTYDAVKNFSEVLKNTMIDILSNISTDWLDWLTVKGNRFLTVFLTGGGSTLPMVEKLAKGQITVKGRTIRLGAAKKFPSWLEDDYPELEDDFSRIAVSLGGARKILINNKGHLNSTATSDVGMRKLNDPRSRW